MLNSSSESGHPCLVSDFRGNAFNFSPLRIMFALGLGKKIKKILRFQVHLDNKMRLSGLGWDKGEIKNSGNDQQCEDRIFRRNPLSCFN